MLTAKVETKGADSYEMANLGLAVGLGGDVAGAEKRFQTAEWFATTKHSRAVILYNRATLLAATKHYKEAKQKLAAALVLSPKQIRNYFALNIYFAEASRKDKGFRSI